MGIQDRDYMRERKIDYSDRRNVMPNIQKTSGNWSTWKIALFWIALFMTIFLIASHLSDIKEGVNVVMMII